VPQVLRVLVRQCQGLTVRAMTSGDSEPVEPEPARTTLNPVAPAPRAPWERL